MNLLLEKHLGKALTVKEVAEYLDLNLSTIRKYYKSLGGIRIGSAYRFFENRLIDAILQQEQEKMDSSSKTSIPNLSQRLPNQERGKRMGDITKARYPESNEPGARRDPHNLFT